MKDRYQHVQGGAHGRLEHIDVTAANGDAVPHATGRRLKPHISGADYDLDWWRTPDARKGLLHKLVDAITRKLFRRRG